MRIVPVQIRKIKHKQAQESLLSSETIRDEEHDGIEIIWSDKTSGFLSVETLRKSCPCASCREARGESKHETPLRRLETSKPDISTANTTNKTEKRKLSLLKVVENSLKEELSLLEIWPVGNYAIGLRWGDGHSTGIYTFSYLYELARAEKVRTTFSASTN